MLYYTILYYPTSHIVILHRSHLLALYFVSLHCVCVTVHVHPLTESDHFLLALILDGHGHWEHSQDSMQVDYLLSSPTLFCSLLFSSPPFCSLLFCSLVFCSLLFPSVLFPSFDTFIAHIPISTTLFLNSANRVCFISSLFHRSCLPCGERFVDHEETRRFGGVRGEAAIR